MAAGAWSPRIRIIEREAATLPPGSSERDSAERLAEALGKEFVCMRADEGVYDRLGFDADYLQYRSPFFGWLKNEQGMSESEINEFCLRSYQSAWRTETMGMAGKIWTQYQWFLFPDYAVFYKYGTRYHERYEKSVSALPAEAPGLSGEARSLYGDYLKRAHAAANRELRVEPVLFLQKVARVIAGFAPLLTLLFFGLLLYSLLNPLLADLRMAGVMALFFQMLVASHALTISIIHALDVNRYRLSYAGPYLLALAAMLVFCLIIGPRIISGSRQKPV